MHDSSSQLTPTRAHRLRATHPPMRARAAAHARARTAPRPRAGRAVARGRAREHRLPRARRQARPVAARRMGARTARRAPAAPALRVPGLAAPNRLRACSSHGASSGRRACGWRSTRAQAASRAEAAAARSARRLPSGPSIATSASSSDSASRDSRSLASRRGSLIRASPPEENGRCGVSSPFNVCASSGESIVSCSVPYGPALHSNRSRAANRSRRRRRPLEVGRRLVAHCRHSRCLGTHAASVTSTRRRPSQRKCAVATPGIPGSRCRW